MLKGILIVGAVVASPFVLYTIARVVSSAVFRSYFELKHQQGRDEKVKINEKIH